MGTGMGWINERYETKASQLSLFLFALFYSFAHR
jgi:hypothetical protein